MIFVRKCLKISQKIHDGDRKQINLNPVQAAMGEVPKKEEGNDGEKNAACPWGPGLEP